MDFVPLTIFFMAYLLNFQENVLGKPAVADIQVSVPEDCKNELNSKNYCTKKPKYGYPSDETLKQLYFNNIDNLDFRFKINETRDRDGQNICTRSQTDLVTNIYMIKDVNGDIRYTLHIPGVFNMIIPTTSCFKDADTMLHPRYRARNIKCKQEKIQYPFIVLSRDQKHLESVKISGVNSACVPVRH